MEQIRIRGLSAGDPVSIVDLLSTDEGAEIEFEPLRLGLTARTPKLEDQSAWTRSP